MKIYYHLNLLLYPALQVSCFVLAAYFVKTNLLYTGLFIFLAAFFMSFSLHISYHHHVHFKPQSKTLNRLVDFLISLVLGLPFHFYKLQHLNHHKYNNEVEDMTSTYIIKDDKTVAKAFIPYVFFWFLNIGGFKKQKEKAIKDRYFTPKDHKKMIAEGLLNILFIMVLFYINWTYGILFGVMFYLGWSMIALHNYGQHLPGKQHQIAYSYYGKFYNRIFMNNGLHYEHHIYPGLEYWDLKEDALPERTNKKSHLLDGFRFAFSRRQAEITTTKKRI